MRIVSRYVVLVLLSTATVALTPSQGPGQGAMSVALAQQAEVEEPDGASEVPSEVPGVDSPSVSASDQPAGPAQDDEPAAAADAPAVPAPPSRADLQAPPGVIRTCEGRMAGSRHPLCWDKPAP